MIRRAMIAAVPALVGAAVVLCLLGQNPFRSDSAQAADDDPSLVLTNATTSQQLIPGRPTYWQIGVVTQRLRVQTLAADLTISGNLADAAAAAGTPATLALSSCTQPWAGSVCPGSAFDALAPTPMQILGVTRTILISSGTSIAPDNYVLATLLLPSAATTATDGETAIVTLKLSISGEPALSGDNDALAHTGGGGPLAHTGSDILPPLALAFGSVALGMLLAAAARLLRNHRNGADEAGA